MTPAVPPLPSGMDRVTTRVPLSDLTGAVDTWDSGSVDPETRFAYIDIASIDRVLKAITTTSCLRAADAPSRARQLVASGDVLVSTVRPNLNAVARVPQQMDKAVASTGFCVLRPDPARLDSSYLYHWVRSPSFVAQMTRRATGASYPAVTDAIVKESRLPVPPLPEQCRIAALLDKADAIRRKRQQAIRLADDLLRSAFLDMFGDPVTNPKKWPTLPVAELAEVTTGKTPPREHPEYYGDAIEWTKSDNINTPSHILTRSVEGLSEAGRALGRSAPAGSTLMTCIAGSQSCIGNVALTDRAVAFNQQINAIVPGRSVDANFLYVQLLLAKPLIQAASTDSMKGMVSKGRLSSIHLPAPPQERQRAFGRWFSGFLRWRSRLDASSGATGDLSHALTQRAFQGAHP